MSMRTQTYVISNTHQGEYFTATFNSDGGWEFVSVAIDFSCNVAQLVSHDTFVMVHLFAGHIWSPMLLTSLNEKVFGHGIFAYPDV